MKENAVLATDSWNFVDLWLKRNSENKAQFYWQQAQNFYNASLNLPKTSSPLTLYYCFLNATKALLITKKYHLQNCMGYQVSLTYLQL
ncbi:MAG: YaaC family protein [Corynebacterium matruchotii]